MLSDLGASEMPLYVKIDTEGYEFEVLKGMEDVFEKKLIKSLCIEIDHVNLKNYGTTPDSIYRFLEANGFVSRTDSSGDHYDEIFDFKEE